MKMIFQKYADNKFMAANTEVELDIEVVVDTFSVYFVLSSAFDKYQFESFDEAVNFAEKKYGIREIYDVLIYEDAYYDELFQQDSDGRACLGGQI